MGCLTNHTVSRWGERTMENGRGASEPHGRPWPIVLRSHEFQGRLRQTGSTAGSRARGRFRNPLSFIRLPSDLPAIPSPSPSLCLPLFLSACSLLISLVLGSLKMINLTVCFRSLSRYPNFTWYNNTILRRLTRGQQASCAAQKIAKIIIQVL